MNEEEEEGQEETEEVRSTDEDEIPLEKNFAKTFQDNFKIVADDHLSAISPTPYKVAIVGMNELGSATAFLLICRQVVTDIVLIDQNPRRLAGRCRSERSFHTQKTVLSQRNTRI